MLRLAEEAKRRRTRGAKDTDGPIDCLAVCACSAESVAWVFHPGSTMSEAVRDFDWASTALGPMTSWCASWLMAVSIMLASHFPIACWLGPDFHLLYNDAYLPILASKHPRALGKPGREIWYDIWHVIEAQHHSVRTSGRSSWAEDQMLIVNRNGYEGMRAGRMSVLTPVRGSVLHVLVLAHSLAIGAGGRDIQRRRGDYRAIHRGASVGVAAVGVGANRTCQQSRSGTELASFAIDCQHTRH